MPFDAVASPLVPLRAEGRKTGFETSAAPPTGRYV